LYRVLNRRNISLGERFHAFGVGFVFFFLFLNDTLADSPQASRRILLSAWRRVERGFLRLTNGTQANLKMLLLALLTLQTDGCSPPMCTSRALPYFSRKTRSGRQHAAANRRSVPEPNPAIKERNRIFLAVILLCIPVRGFAWPVKQPRLHADVIYSWAGNSSAASSWPYPDFFGFSPGCSQEQ
jgi:hypothetical protein